MGRAGLPGARMQFPSLRLRGIPTEELAVDLGSTHVYIFSRNRGLVVGEPAVAAVDIAEGEVIATGSEALELVGRLSGRAAACQPLGDGAVGDSALTEELASTV